MLILRTCRVVLHPSYLQKVFILIISIKEKYSFMILSEKSRAPGRAPWAELKSDEHLSADWKQNTDIWCRFTYHLQFWIIAQSFSIKPCAKLPSNWALFIKRSSINTLAKLLPRKTNCIHCLRNAGFFWEAEQGYLSLTTKNTLL